MKMKGQEVLFSKRSDEWATPQDFFDKLNTRWVFTLDPCATKENAKCPKFYTMADDGLTKSWAGETVFMNPPYSKISLWIEKAYREGLRAGTYVVCLLPSRTDTKWFHEYALKGRIEFIRGRLRFGGSKNAAPFPSIIVAFGGYTRGIF